MRDQIETLRLGGPVSGEIDNNSVFRFGAFETIEWTGFQTRWSGFACKPLDRSENVYFRRILVQQLDYFDAFESGELSLPPPHFFAKALRVGLCVFQVVLRVLILVHADGNDVSRAFAFERIGAVEH